MNQHFSVFFFVSTLAICGTFLWITDHRYVAYVMWAIGIVSLWLAARANDEG